MNVDVMNVDVIILSSEKTRELTFQTIDTLKKSEDEINFDIIIIENSDYEYSGVVNLKVSDEFNYNRFMNIGAKQGTSDYIVFANNDLVFEKGWFTKLLEYDFDCMSPRNPIDFRQKDYKEPIISGFEIGYVFSGWCFVLKRKIWEDIGGLDDDFKFWYADNATVEQLKNINVIPNLITQSHVIHLGSQTINKESKDVRQHLTSEQQLIFLKKYCNKNNKKN